MAADGPGQLSPLAWITAPLAAPEPTDPPLQLRDADLRAGLFAGADLRDADLRRAMLSEADLRGADLRGARLHKADLVLADLSGADLRGADLSDADLSGADLRDARLEGADLSGASVAWCWIQGARGVPDSWLQRPRTEGRMRGEESADGEPAAGLKAAARADNAWKQARFALAERHYRTALRWVPDSDAARYMLGALALERADPRDAQRWWQQAIDQYARADRARIDLAFLLWDQSDTEGAAEALNTPAPAWLAELRAEVLKGDRQAAISRVVAKAGETPGVRWLLGGPRRRAVRPSRPKLNALETTEGRELERQNLVELVKDPQQAPWVWHGAIARALQLGDLALAQRAEQRLHAVAPEERLWSLQIKQLDVTEQAFRELMRTRVAGPEEVQAVRWVALGAHGPTAQITCTERNYYAKRYHGATRPAGSVAYTHRICRALFNRGALVPVAMADRSGDEVLVFGGDTLALYPDLGGQPLHEGMLDLAAAERLGRTLGELHILGQDLGGSGRPRGGVRVGTRILRSPHPRTTWLGLLGREAACAAAFQRHPSAELLLAGLDGAARRLRSVLPGCRPGLVHGDFAFGNALLQDDGRVAAVDWDLADTDLLVWDLARSIDLQTVIWPDEPSQPVQIQAPLARAILRGYEAVRPLSADERRALPVLVAASRVDLDASVLPIMVPMEPATAEPVLARQVVRLVRAAAGAPELAEALA